MGLVICAASISSSEGKVLIQIDFSDEAIPGWLSEDEAITLYRLARELPANTSVVVEIGSWLGKVVLCFQGASWKGASDVVLYRSF